jgi:hypothetical protein
VPTLATGTNVMVIVVSGAGSNSFALTQLQCSAATVRAAVQGGGSVVLTLSTSVLALTAVKDVGSPRFAGAVEHKGALIRFQGTSTGTSAALQASC